MELLITLKNSSFMQSKSLLIAIAAFAVTTTGVQAYSANILDRANLTDEQKNAIMEARELREVGNYEEARDLLAEAGIDEDVLRTLHQAKHEARAEMKAALEAGDYEAFLEVVADTPLADIITSESDFEDFREAHQLRQEGDKEGAKAILDDLGIEREHKGHHKGKRYILSQLSDEQREAFMVAKQANDRATMQAILDEAGVELPNRR